MEQVASPNELLPWAGLVVPIVTAAVTGFFAYRIGMRKDASTTEEVLHGGFKILIDELQAERDRLSAQLEKVIGEGNTDIKREMQERFDEIETRIEHNRRNADHNFGIINEIIQEQITEHAKGRKRFSRIVPQRVPLDPPARK